MRTEGKAEIIDERIIQRLPLGDVPGYAGDSIIASLWAYVEQPKRGRAIGDNKRFPCNSPYRLSFSPDAPYRAGPRGGMKFYPKPPVFAVEVRSENELGALLKRKWLRNEPIISCRNANRLGCRPSK